uniref:Transmembrane protein n=1 Tax=Rhizochromulina marina TaxID=1034831 RepID=A0A7S2SU74_9STRA|mmetsp:Transcript_6118/g.17881  ORF Transcript_6118/g.17881 Transcript_6118/m.17881 type:complete len:358 (+) Transcript_6118:71-1144(+)
MRGSGALPLLVLALSVATPCPGATAAARTTTASKGESVRELRRRLVKLGVAREQYKSVLDKEGLVEMLRAAEERAESQERTRWRNRIIWGTAVVAVMVGLVLLAGAEIQFVSGMLWRRGVSPWLSWFTVFLDDLWLSLRGLHGVLALAVVLRAVIELFCALATTSMAVRATCFFLLPRSHTLSRQVLSLTSKVSIFSVPIALGGLGVDLGPLIILTIFRQIGAAVSEYTVLRLSALRWEEDETSHRRRHSQQPMKVSSWKSREDRAPWEEEVEGPSIEDADSPQDFLLRCVLAQDAEDDAVTERGGAMTAPVGSSRRDFLDEGIDRSRSRRSSRSSSHSEVLGETLRRRRGPREESE